MKNTIYFLMACLLISITTISCGDEEGQMEESPKGLAISTTSLASANVYEDIRTAIDENAAIGIVAEVNHSDNAGTVEVDLLYTRVILFGNPALGTPLMQENILTGLDLPQKILVTATAEGDTRVSYNDPTYLKSRHGLTNDSTLSKIGSALQKFTGDATGEAVDQYTNLDTAKDDGIVSVTSNNDFEVTYTKIKEALAENANLRIIAELNHTANASSVGLTLPNSRLIVFGNPNLGSPLMVSSQSIGIDLPQKVLVYEEEDQVKVAYNDPQYLARRFGIDDQDEIIGQITAALGAIAQAGTEE